MNTPSRKIRPDDLWVFAQIPGILAVARDADLRVVWCTPAYGKIAGNDSTVEQMIGTRIEDVVPEAAARDRIESHREVMRTGEVQSHFRLMSDTRVVSTVFALDQEAFGHRGVLVIVQDASAQSKFFDDVLIPVMATTNLYKLEPLTGRELEVLRLVACGNSTREIADLLCRAEKTVEHHINAIHGKIGTGSRAQLVRFASERGLQLFTESEWAQIVDGVQRVRRESARGVFAQPS